MAISANIIPANFFGYTVSGHMTNEIGYAILDPLLGFLNLFQSVV